MDSEERSHRIKRIALAGDDDNESLSSLADPRHGSPEGSTSSTAATVRFEMTLKHYEGRPKGRPIADHSSST